jgi:hypothetical protein
MQADSGKKGLHQMTHRTDSVPVVVRPRWRGTDEQEQVLDNIARGFEESRQREEAAWVDVQKARELGIPDTVICQRGDISRTTLQRRLGHRPDGD